MVLNQTFSLRNDQILNFMTHVLMVQDGRVIQCHGLCAYGFATDDVFHYKMIKFKCHGLCAYGFTTDVFHCKDIGFKCHGLGAYR